ncbi:hypothetical protein OEZ85_002592 [Tetradesmus obliquus]|uniref:Sulfatase N-terminal domain-containing protein n=1 Tax=Tetradesmus obliquus TaxID=3088 RepID=A0ABY8TY10_TETOB|nr:hypothetical protein OEZ85_002592 [Tetradesmus obliquus]
MKKLIIITLFSIAILFSACALSGAHAASQQQQQQQQQQQDSSRAKPIPALKPGQKPNFIMILTDDVGWDDLGFHNPRVKTPNINKLRQRSTVFENFYTSPQCAQSRAQFLTGRSYARTGTMAVSGGWDFINRDEVTIGEAMAAGGYRTAHFGKWHNLQVLGYEPWHNGFEDGYIPPSTGADGEGLARLNGRYVVAAEGGHVYDNDLRNQTVAYLQKRVKDKQPFFVFWAARSIHTNYILPDPVTGKPIERRIVPAEYRDRFNTPEYNNVANSTKDAWAFMEYLDDALGPMFDFLTDSGLDQSTYLMFTADNGPAVYHDESPPLKKLIRMPSGMAGAKHSTFEGGIRNALVVQGPGVKTGATDNTMIANSDIFPTMVDIAGVNASVAAGLQLDGISFKSVLLPSGSRRNNNRTADVDLSSESMSWTQQQSSLTWRYFFMLGPACWGPNAVPELAPDRSVVKPQQLLDYNTGGSGWPSKKVFGPGPGFKSCVVVRYRNYKWLGSSSKVFQFPEGKQHWEIPQNEVTGFYNAGESMCFKMKVLTAGTYTATAIYTSNSQATFRLSVGSYADIKAGTARSLTMQWPAQGVMRGMSLGNLTLPASREEKTEACLQLLPSPALDGKTAVFQNFANIQWTRVSNKRSMTPQSPASSSSSVTPADLVPAASAGAAPVAVPAPGLDLTGRYSWVHQVASRAARVSSAQVQDAWSALRLRHAWPDGQSELESMFSPYDAEGVEECPAELHAACRPLI